MKRLAPSSIEFITGVMNSGKSFELLERIEEALDKGLNILILKPSIDVRDGAFVKSRKTDKTYAAIPVDETDIPSVIKILDSTSKVDVVFLDEVQFISENFVEKLIIQTFHHGISIVASGLTKDFKGEYFPSSNFLTQYTTFPIEFKQGICHCCGKPKGKPTATIDVRMDAKDNIVTEGDSVSVEGTDSSYHYETVCEKCYEKKGGK